MGLLHAHRKMYIHSKLFFNLIMTTEDDTLRSVKERADLFPTLTADNKLSFLLINVYILDRHHLCYHHCLRVFDSESLAKAYVYMSMH